MQQEIQVATIEAQCNHQVHLTRRLADVEAGFQAPQIRRQRRGLVQEWASSASTVAAARAVVGGLDD